MRPMPPEPEPDTICRSLDSVACADPPAVVDLADAVRVGDARAVEEDLVELDLAGDLAQRSHLDAGLVHVEQEVGDALVLGRVGIGARQQDREVGDVRPTWSTPSGR